MKRFFVTMVGLVFLFSATMVSAQTKVVEPAKPVVSTPVAPLKLDAKAEKKAAKDKKAAEKKAAKDKKAAEKVKVVPAPVK